MKKLKNSNGKLIRDSREKKRGNVVSNLLKKELRIGINMKKEERMILLRLERIDEQKNKIECLRKVEIIVIKNNNKIREIVNIIQTNLCKT